MFLGVIFCDRGKGIQAHMQGDIRDLHAFDLQLLQQARREVKSGCRRGGRTRLACVDRLIAFGVIQLFVNIRRQRNIAHFGKIWLDGFGKFDEAF